MSTSTSVQPRKFEAAPEAVRLRPDGPPRRFFSSQGPTMSPGQAAKAVAEDASLLIRAEIALAKAEVTASIKAKAVGAGLLVAAAVAGWLALQGLLITAGFLLALVLPGWAAALIVSAILLLVTGVAALLGKRKLAVPVKLDTTKQNVEEDVAWTRAHLPSK